MLCCRNYPSIEKRNCNKNLYFLLQQNLNICTFRYATLIKYANSKSPHMNNAKAINYSTAYCKKIILNFFQENSLSIHGYLHLDDYFLYNKEYNLIDGCCPINQL